MRWLVLVAIALAARADAQGGPGWDLKVPERLELPAGSTGTLPISIAIDRGQTISKDAALILDLAPEPGVSVKRRHRLGRADAVDPDDEMPRFTVPVGTQGAGDYTIKLHLRFWLCGTRVCRPIDARRTFTVSVTAPATPPPADAGVDAAPADAARKRGR